MKTIINALMCAIAATVLVEAVIIIVTTLS